MKELAMATIVLRKKHVATETGAALLQLLVDITTDGELTLAEVRKLGAWLEANTGQGDIPAVSWLQECVADALADGKLTASERAGLLDAIERVLPPEQRDVAKTARKEVEEVAEVKAAAKRLERAARAPAPPPVSVPRFEPEATERQLAYLRILGVSTYPGMTKAEASDAISLAKANPRPSNRQQMVLRFWGQSTAVTPAEVSRWMDKLYSADPDYKDAWELWKAENGDVGAQSDPIRVPFGVGDQYLARIKASRPKPTTISDLNAMLVAAAIIALGIGLTYSCSSWFR